MNFNFPRSRFADSNTIDDQVSHIMGEACEVARASYEADLDATVMEIFDIIHSCETAMWIIAREKGFGYIFDMKIAVERKNRLRGYYDMAASYAPGTPVEASIAT